jgi:branched-chain amino acid transport system permease protein
VIGRLLAATALIAIGACTPVVDPARLALCREVLPALHEAGTVISGTRDEPGDGGVKITYLAERPGRPRTVHSATCRFDGEDSHGRPDLVGLVTERGPLSAVRLLILKRWWLGQVPAPARATTVDFREAFPDLARDESAAGGPS